MLRSIIQQILTALELVAELRQTPWGNDLDGGLQSVEGKFETDLIVALARTSM